MLAVGTSEGVWIGLYGHLHSFHKVLHLRGVTQCDVLEQFGHFLVLADRTLIAYDLNALVPSHSTPLSFAPQKLSGNRDVLFFATGYVKGRPLMVYGKKKTNETSVRVLEPIDASSSQHDDSKGLWRRRHSETFSGFREYKKFYVGYEATGAQFLRNGVAVYTHRGFQTFSLETESLDLLPLVKLRDDTYAWSMLRQLESARPLGLFYLPNDLMLLCYDRIACYTDLEGHLVRLDGTFQWEGRPLRVASVSKYILAFSDSFVEVWDALAGKLCQTLPGTNLRLLSKQDNAHEQSPTMLVVEHRQHISELRAAS